MNKKFLNKLFKKFLIPVKERQNIKEKKKKKFKKIYLSKNFKMNLIQKKNISDFYGNIKTFKLKKIVNNCKSNIIINLESQLNFFLKRYIKDLSLKNLNQLILNGCVYVNNRKIFNKSYVLRNGDIVKIMGINLYKNKTIFLFYKYKRNMVFNFPFYFSKNSVLRYLKE